MVKIPLNPKKKQWMDGLIEIKISTILSQMANNKEESRMLGILSKYGYKWPLKLKNKNRRVDG